jgi:hypothetical protein
MDCMLHLLRFEKKLLFVCFVKVLFLLFLFVALCYYFRFSLFSEKLFNFFLNYYFKKTFVSFCYFSFQLTVLVYIV